MSKLKVALIIFAVAVFALVVGTFVYKYVSKDTSAESQLTTDQVLAEEWQFRSIGDTGISIIAPSSLEEVKLPSYENAKDRLDGYEMYTYRSGYFEFTLIELTAKDSEPDAEEYSKGFAKTVKKTKGISRYKYDLYPVEINGRKGYFVKGTANTKGLEVSTDSIVFTEGKDLWHIYTRYDENMPKLVSLMEKVLNSVEINEGD
ncbi:hypothetical protein [Limisalsivibrio acetivorans]|uniref:hypothetical protein n=1 Tax=Limisalsivibrio acetivorans TaxID=1304888 RepID=UPI0003B2F69B|nr:hypothetical protein [Limisalsivibrio acetivorans]